MAVLQLAGAGCSWPKASRSPEEVQEYEDLKRELNEEARANWGDPAWHRQQAADIAEQVDYSFTFTNEFDRGILRERRGLKVFYTSRGGEIEESQLKIEEWELPRDTLGYHVSEHEDKLRANYSQTIEDLVSLAEERMDAEQWRRALSLLESAIGPTTPQYVSVNGLAKDNVVDGIRTVRDAIKPNGVFNIPITIAGRATMVDKISDFDMGFDPEATAEIRARGRLGVFRGATVQQILNYTDENAAPYVPGNELWIFGGNVGQFARYGGMQTKDFREATAWYWHQIGRKDFGGLVHHSEQCVRLVDTTESA